MSDLPSLYFLSIKTTPPAEIYTLSLHDALPISPRSPSTASRSSTRAALATSRSGGPPSRSSARRSWPPRPRCSTVRSEEHTSELQSRRDLVCRLLLEKKKEITFLCLSLPTSQQT